MPNGTRAMSAPRAASARKRRVASRPARHSSAGGINRLGRNRFAVVPRGRSHGLSCDPFCLRSGRSSIARAVAALRVLYKVTLNRDWIFGEVIPLPKKPQKLPVVLSPKEVAHFLACVGSGKHRVILTTCYAAGLRISEAIRLKPAAID